MNIQNSTQPTGIAALDCSLQGGYLIEASAGTGKTWTLTGVILRLLVEKKYPPERIVATTFTRAAAAEMQERINQRLQAFYAFIRWFKSCQLKQASWFDVEQLSANLPQIVQQASGAGVDASDPIHQYLLGVLLTDERSLDEAIYRTGLLLTTLDKLFVGTLDSLTQKWLKEFASQIGYHTQMELSNHANEQILSLIHDQIRRSEVELKQYQPTLYAVIKGFGGDWIFRDVLAVKDQINLPLQFFTAPIDDIDGASSLDELVAPLDAIKKELHDFATMDLKPFDDFFCTPIDELFKKGFKKNAETVLTGLSQLAKLTTLVREQGVLFVQQLNQQHYDFLAKVAELDDDKIESLFKKGCEPTLKERFISLPFDQINCVNRAMSLLEQMVFFYQQHLLKQIAHIVRSRLGEVLEAQNKTTFTLQMVRLTSALANNPALARHIRHHYPVALIDESQDINGLQVQLIEQVYLSPLLSYRLDGERFETVGGDKPLPPKGFLLLVGDPKQAIYRFRGGDVTNYNLVKNYGKKQCGQPILDTSLVLDVNRRSNRELIESLNVWFGDNGLMGVQNHAYLGDGIAYRKIAAFEEKQRLSWQNTPPVQSYLSQRPVTILHSEYAGKSMVPNNIALHINSLLQSNQTITNRPIQPSDIAVLASNKNDLAQVQQALETLGIQAVAASSVNVFATQAGQDIYALLMAVLSPSHSAILGRWLTSPMMGLTLCQSLMVQGLLDDKMTDDDNERQHSSHDTLVDGVWAGLTKLGILTYLRVVGEKWQQYGLASALNFAFTHSPVDFSWQHRSDDKDAANLWLASARLGERYLADVWQLVELVGQKSLWHEQKIIAWYEKMMTAGDDIDESCQRQILPSETGVNLMTIHKSKGLEFPIVYVLSMDKTAKVDDDVGFYPYSDADYHRRLSPVPSGELDFARLNHAEAVDEFRRLGYVALTRASEQIFVVVSDGYNASGIDNKPIHQWFDQTDKKCLSLPDRLSGVVGWIELDQCKDLIDKPYCAKSTQKQPIVYPAWQSILPKTYFNGVYQTSFTALVAKLDRASQAAAVMGADYDGLMQDDGGDGSVVGGNDVRATFMRGRFAGDFLHKVLQNAQTPAELGRAIDEQVKSLGLPAQYASPSVRRYLIGEMELVKQTQADEHQALIDWLSCVMSTPFLASKTALVDLPKAVQVRELGFVLGLNEAFSLEKLNEIFAKYSDKPLVLSDDDAVDYRYLRGEIDLVYEQDGRFFVVDYKSNHLGNLPSDYDTPSLEYAMAKAGYWLQAAIYQVAIHRLLKVRLADYQGNEQQYLGAVEYVFLRGVCHDSAELGRIIWQPPISLILALDEIF